MKRIGDHARFKYRLEYGDPPRRGDVLVTRTNRHYLVLAVTPGRKLLSVECLVVDPAKLETNGRRYTLVWNKRKRRAA